MKSIQHSKWEKTRHCEFQHPWIEKMTLRTFGKKTQTATYELGLLTSTLKEYIKK